MYKQNIEDNVCFELKNIHILMKIGAPNKRLRKKKVFMNLPEKNKIKQNSST